MKKSSRILVAVIILTATIITSCTTAKHSNCGAYGHKTINVKSAFTCATF